MIFDINKKTRVLSYGLLTDQGRFYTEQSIVYGTNFVAGVQPGKGGREFCGLPVFDSIQEAVTKKNVDVCVIHGAKSIAYTAIKDAIEAKIKIIICLVGGIPLLDMVKIKELLAKSDSLLIGPSSLGIIIPDQCKLGVIPGQMVKKGNVGLISRHGSLTFEVLNQIKKENLGISACISLGSEVVKGIGLIASLRELLKNKQTKVIVILGNISGFDEERVADFYRKIPQKNKKPVVLYMAGSFYDFLGKTTYKEQLAGQEILNTKQKKELLINAGITIIESPAAIAKTVKDIVKQ